MNSVVKAIHHLILFSYAESYSQFNKLWYNTEYIENRKRQLSRVAASPAT